MLTEHVVMWCNVSSSTSQSGHFKFPDFLYLFLKLLFISNIPNLTLKIIRAWSGRRPVIWLARAKLLQAIIFDLLLFLHSAVSCCKGNTNTAVLTLHFHSYIPVHSTSSSQVERLYLNRTSIISLAQFSSKRLRFISMYTFSTRSSCYFWRIFQRKLSFLMSISYWIGRIPSSMYKPANGVE